MSDNRKYYYLKLKESYFDDDAIRLYRFHWEEIQEPCSHYPQMGG